MGIDSTPIQARTVYRQTEAPPDTSALWLDTTTDPATLKTYNSGNSEWNNAASSVVTKKDTAPAEPVEGDLWQDTSGSPALLKYYDSDTSQWNTVRRPSVLTPGDLFPLPDWDSNNAFSETNDTSTGGTDSFVTAWEGEVWCQSVSVTLKNSTYGYSDMECGARFTFEDTSENDEQTGTISSNPGTQTFSTGVSYNMRVKKVEVRSDYNFNVTDLTVTEPPAVTSIDTRFPLQF